jgi:membrane protein
MASIWRLSRPKTQLTNAWRWVAVVMALALAAVVTSSLGRFTDPIPPRNVWTLVLTFGLDILVAVFMPWLLVANREPVRRLIPGGVVFALAMLVARPAYEAYLPRALEKSADQYGSIGVAFTYLAALYVVSFIFLAAAIIGTSSPRTKAGWVSSSVAGGRLGPKTRLGPESQPSQPLACEQRGCRWVLCLAGRPLDN